MSEQRSSSSNWPYDDGTISQYIWPMAPRSESGYPSQISDVDIEYLTRRNAFLLPPKHVQVAMLQAYIDYVHPFMPVLDLDHFNLFEDNETALGTISLASTQSLLVLQSVMFSGSAFIKLEDIRISGYDSPKAYRNELYNRAKALYDCNYDSDPIAIIQSALLLSTWHPEYPNTKDTRHWISIAISVAQKENLHRECHYLSLDQQQRRFQKRLWWACYIRDRLAALGLGRPMVIAHDESNMPLLSMEDFDEDLPVTVPGINATFSCLANKSILTIEMSKLCMCISDILDKYYSTSFIEQGAGSSFGDTGHIAVLAPDNKSIDLSTFDNIVGRLEDLAVELSAEGLTDIAGQGCEQQCQFPSHLVVNSKFLLLTYHATSCALHRLKAQWTGNEDQSHNTSYQKLVAATTHMTGIVKELVHLGLVRFLAPSGAVYLLPAMVGHIRRMKSTECGVKLQAMDDFHQCLKALRIIAEYHHIADYAISFLETVTRKQNVCLPFNLRSESDNVVLEPESTIYDSWNLGHAHMSNDVCREEEDDFIWKQVIDKAVSKGHLGKSTATRANHISYLIDDEAEDFDPEPLLSSWDGSLHELLLAPFPSDLYTH